MSGGRPPEQTEGSTAERRRVLHVVELLNLVFLGVDVALFGRHAVPVLAGRLAVSAGLRVADVALAHPGSPARLRSLLAAAMLVVVAGFAQLATGTGGEASPYLTFLAFVPIVVTIVVPDEPVAPLTSGVGATLASTGFALAGGAGPARLGFTLAACASCTFYGTASAVLYRRMRRREHGAAAARAAALTELARSERRRLEAERLAAVGRLVAGFRHDVNNPLASATSNLRYVDEELARAEVDPDVAGALQDTLASLERIRRLVADLGALSVAAGTEVEPVAVEPAIRRALELLPPPADPADPAARADAPGSTSSRVRVRASEPQLSELLGLLVRTVANATAPARAPGARADLSDLVTVSVAEAVEGTRITIQGAGATPAAANTPRPPSALVLGVCQELAGRWGGRVEACEGPGGALRFALTLLR